MGDATAIAWTDHTFNPWMGCHKVSQGCTHCYAETLTKGRMGKPDLWGATGHRQRTGPGVWRKPYKWNSDAAREGRRHRVFTASLADVFEDKPELEPWREELWQVVRDCPMLDFQILTKRPENIGRMIPRDWNVTDYRNVWLGTSIEDNRVAHRAKELVEIPAVIHFISYEPAIGPLTKISLEHIEWMIVGGESGPGYRKMDLKWAQYMRERCDREKIAFFFKQNSAPYTERGIDALGEIVRAYPLDAGEVDPLRSLANMPSVQFGQQRATHH